MRGHEAVHVSEILPGSTPDSEIALFAQQNGFVVITKDDDFGRSGFDDELQVVWLRIGNTTNKVLIGWLERNWAEVEAALRNGERLVEVQ